MSHSLAATLEKIVSSVRDTGYDRVRLYLLTPDRRGMVCQSHVGMPVWFLGSCRPAENDPYLQVLLGDPRPHVFHPQAGWATPFDDDGYGAAGCPEEWACIPLLSQGQVIGKLSVDNYLTGKSLDVEELQRTAHFAAQAVMAIEAARWAHTLAIFNRVAAAISSTLEIEEILARTCQAAQELFQVSHSGLLLYDDDFSSGVVKAEYPPDLGTVGLRLPLRGIPVEERLVKNQTPIVLDDLAGQLPDSALRDILLGLGIQSILVVPMVSRGKLLGSFSLDAIGYQRSFTPEEVELCKTLATQVALALENAQRFQELQQQLICITAAKSHLELAMQAGHLIAQADNLTEALQILTRQVVTSLSGSYCRISLTTEGGHKLTVAAAYAAAAALTWQPKPGATFASAELPEFSQLRVMEYRHLQADADPQTRAQLEQWSRQLGLPKPLQTLLLVGIKVDGQLLGVLELGELRSGNDTVLREERIKVTTAIAAQTAVLVDRLQRLEATQLAAEAMSGAVALPQALQAIADHAQKLFQAHATVVWAYDNEAQKYVTDAVAAAGLTPEWLAALRQMDLSPGVITQAILRDGELSISDLDRHEAPLVREQLRALLDAADIHSLFGIRLQAGGATAGFLFICHAAPHNFTEVERQRYKNFAAFAALALRKAALLRQAQTVKDLAGTVTKVLTTAGNVNSTLQLIADETREVLGCDAITLYAYDEPNDKLIYPPTTAGLNDSAQTAALPKMRKHSIVYQMLHRNEPYIVTRVADDERFNQRRFASAEQVASLVVTPLRVAGRRTGVAFFNYRTERRFTEEELRNIGMFADLAALAIHNAQIHEERAAKLSERVLLAYLSQEFLDATNQHAILSRAVEVARSILRSDFASIVLADGAGDLLTVATAGWEEWIAGKHRPGNGLNSHAGYTIQHRIPVRVADYTTERRFQPPPIVFEKGLQSGLSAPLKLAEGVTGAILVQTLAPHDFSTEEETLLRLLADETSLALQLLQGNEALQSAKGKAERSDTLARVGLKSSTLAHEMHSGMGTIRAQLEELSDPLADRDIPAWMHKYLEIIKHETLKLVELSRLPTADEGLADVALNPLVESQLAAMRETLRQTMPEYACEFKAELAAETVIVRANSRWLGLVLNHLLKNAVAAVRTLDMARCTITVQVRVKDGYAELAVIDCGEGMPEAVQQQLFKGQVKHTGKNQGLGIGLLKASFIVETYNGSIGIGYTGTTGTEMIIRLPLALKPTVNQTPNAAHQPPLNDDSWGE